jgi:hypothetical protein
LADRASHAVGADHVPGANLAAAPARTGKREHVAAVGAVLESNQLDTAFETDAPERAEVLLEQRLELVLRQAGG